MGGEIFVGARAITTRYLRHRNEELARSLVMNSQRFFPGGLAIAVPGEVSGQYQAWKLYGKLTWKDLVNPAIDLARDGFPISQSLADAMKDEFEKIKHDEGLR